MHGTLSNKLYTETRVPTFPNTREEAGQTVQTIPQGCLIGNPSAYDLGWLGIFDDRQAERHEPHSHNPASGLQSYAPVNTRAAFSPSYMACVPMGQPSPGMHHRIVRPIPLQLSDRERWYSGTNSLLQKQIEADPPQEQGTDPLTLKHLSLPTTAMEPDLRTAIQDLMRFCTHAQQVPRTQQVEEHITDKLIYPIARLPASKGSGSRNGHEAYQCLWPRCHKITLRKGNAVSHLLSHVQYKPFVCQECPKYPRFRYKHDLIRHCKSHTFYIPI